MNAPIIFTDLVDTPYIEYKTTVNKRDIYMYNEFPDKHPSFLPQSSPGISWINYFSLPKNTNIPCKYYFYSNTLYISIFIQNVLHFINTKNTGFTEEQKTAIADSVNQSNYAVPFNKNPDITYINISQLRCIAPHDLTNAKREVARLNARLNCIDYDVSIDYVFDMQNYNDVSAYNEKGLSLSRPLLCISHKNSCVSSLELTFDSNNEDIIIDSKTSPEFENKKMNKLLRTILVLISKSISPDIKYIESFAIHPASVHLMVNVLNATAYYTDNENIEYEIPKNRFVNFSTIDDIIDEYDILTVKIFLTEENINNANAVFNTMVDSFCTKMNGGKRKTRNRKKRIQRIQRRKTRRARID